MDKHETEIFNYTISHDTYITIVVTLIVFVIGLAISTYLSITRRYNHRFLTKLNHRLFIRETYKQSQDYADYQAQLHIEHEGNFTFLFRLMRSISVFKEFGYENTYNAYFSGFENIFLSNKTKKIKAFDTLWRHIEFIEKTHENSIKDSTEIVRRNAELNDLRNESVGNAQKFMERFLLEFEGQVDFADEFGKFVFKRQIIMSNLRANNNHTLPHHTFNYLRELINLNRNNPELVRRYKNDIQSVDFNAIVLESEVRFENMKRHLQASADSYEYLSKEYGKISKQLIESYRILNPKSGLLKMRKYSVKKILKNKLISG